MVLPEKTPRPPVFEFLYGMGMRISECSRLRVCDPDFDRGRIPIRGRKRNDDQMTMLPRSLEERLKTQLEFVRLRHECDVQNGTVYAPVPTFLEHKRHWGRRRNSAGCSCSDLLSFG